MKLSFEKIRAWWSHRQALDGSLATQSPADVLIRSGWARSVAGVGPYLTFHSRAGISREAADHALANIEIHEMPAARGCTYVVPECDYALALVVSSKFGFVQEWRVAEKLGVKPKELERLCGAVVDALDHGPLDPDGIRESVGDKVRPLGDEGKRKGMISTLPLALGKLQQAGIIRRIPTNGRLDNQRYKYSKWTENPLSNCSMTTDEAMEMLAQRFFRWIGPATIAEFAWFSGLGLRAAKTVVDAIGVVALPEHQDRFLFADDLDSLQSYKIPKSAQYRCVSSLDAIHSLRRNITDLLEPADLQREVLAEKTCATLGGLSDLPNHVILDRGRIVGLWEYDIEQQSIVWHSWLKSNRDLQNAVKATQSFVTDELGDARSFSLDSPKSRIPRLEFLRGLAS